MLRFLTIWYKLIFCTERNSCLLFHLNNSVELPQPLIWSWHWVTLFNTNFGPIIQGVEWPPCIERVTQPSVAVKARHKSEGRQVQGVNFYEHFIQRLHPVGSSFWKLGLINMNFVGVIHSLGVSCIVVFKKGPSWPIQRWTCTAFTWRISFFSCRVFKFWVCPECGP